MEALICENRFQFPVLCTFNFVVHIPFLLSSCVLHSLLTVLASNLGYCFVALSPVSLVALYFSLKHDCLEYFVYSRKSKV